MATLLDLAVGDIRAASDKLNADNVAHGATADQITERQDIVDLLHAISNHLIASNRLSAGILAKRCEALRPTMDRNHGLTVMEHDALASSRTNCGRWAGD